jgi:hypothetical protein
VTTTKKGGTTAALESRLGLPNQIGTSDLKFLTFYTERTECAGRCITGSGRHNTYISITLMKLKTTTG